MSAMRRILCVAEKNDVAKGVSAILSRGSAVRKEGRSPFNKIYQFHMDVFGQQATIAMTSVSGHMLNYEFPSEMKSWSNVPIENCFSAPVLHKVIPNMERIEQTLKEEAPKHDTLIIFTDCDREGEAIGAEVVKTCLGANRRLDVYRAKFSEITNRAITNAMNRLVRLDMRMVDAVDCRSELDLRIGAAFSRLQTLHLRSKCPGIFTEDLKIVSYGSCQFPTLGFVVERYKAIENFVREPFWKLVIDHTRNGVKTEFNWDRQRLFDRDAVDALYEDCIDARSARVTNVQKKPKSRWRPQALDTVELEKLAVRKLKMSAKTAMTIAEKLYNKGFISYPRTETNKFPNDIQLDQLAQQQTASGDWGDFAGQVFHRGPNPRNGTKSDEAHPPIHPLKFATKVNMDPNEWKIYELVVRHFLACISWDAKGQETKVDLKCGDELFHATGLVIEDLGYMNVFVYEKWSDKTLPPYRDGEVINDHQLRMADGQTQPPQLLNEADLIALMDRFGIGTDATHAEHIEKIKERAYVGVQPDGRFIPAFLGLALVDGYDAMGFAMSKPHMRADLERQLQAICAGTRAKQDVLDEQKARYKRIFDQSEVQILRLSQALQRYLQQNPNERFPPSNGGQPPPSPPRPPRGGGRGASTRGRGNTPRTRGIQPPEPLDIESDEMPLMPGAPRARGGRQRGDIRGARGGAGGTVPQAQTQMAPAGKNCLCGVAAAMRTVRKDGPNKGKHFLGCNKEMSDPTRCNFFEWQQQ